MSSYIRNWRVRQELERCTEPSGWWNPYDYPGHPYGIRSVTPNYVSPVEQFPGFRHEPHAASSFYHRDHPSGVFQGTREGILHKICPWRHADSYKTIVATRQVPQEGASLSEIYEGLWMLQGVREQRSEEDKTLLHIGATASFCQLQRVLQLMNGQGICAKRGALQNISQLNQMTRSMALRAISRKGKMDGIPFQSIYHATNELLLGLKIELANVGNKRVAALFDGSLIARNALKQMDSSLAVLALKSATEEEILAAFFLFIDDLEILLSNIELYSEKDCHEATLIPQNARSGPCSCLREFRQRSILVSSGMQAIYTALLAARAIHGDNLEQTLYPDRRSVYFEILKIIHPTEQASPRIYVAELSSNMPTASTPTREALLQKMQTQLNEAIEQGVPFLTLILDTTLETDPTDIEFFLNGLQKYLRSGQLNFICCKSYQKYAMLGTGKVMAGNLVMFNDGSEKFAKALDIIDQKQQEPLMQSSQRHLMAHLLKYGHRAEMMFVKRCTENADFIKPFFDEAAFHKLSDGVKSPLISFKQAALMLLLASNVLELDSFGWNTSTILSPQTQRYRLSVGQESRARMIELFYATGRMSKDISKKTAEEVWIPRRNQVFEDLQAILNQVDVAIKEVQLSDPNDLRGLLAFAKERIKDPALLTDFFLKALSWQHLWYNATFERLSKATNSDKIESSRFTTDLMLHAFDALPQEQQTHLATCWLKMADLKKSLLEEENSTRRYWEALRLKDSSAYCASSCPFKEPQLDAILERCKQARIPMNVRFKVMNYMTDEEFNALSPNLQTLLIEVLVKRYPACASLHLLWAAVSRPQTYGERRGRFLREVAAYLRRTTPALNNPQASLNSPFIPATTRFTAIETRVHPWTIWRNIEHRLRNN